MSESAEKPTEPLPDFVQPFMDKLVEEYRRLDMTTPEVLMRQFAWQRWAETLTNRELGEYVMFIRCELVKSGESALAVKLEEVWRRLKSPRMAKKTGENYR